MSDKKTGLAGVDALFQSPTETETIEAKPPSQPKSSPTAKQSDKPQKVITTVRVFTTTLAQMQEIKIHLLKQGQRVNNGDIMDEAIADLYQKMGLDGK